jgi:glycosyltransferase involved in cell wall biosynthesis
VNVDWFFLSHRLPLALAARRAGAEVWVAALDTGKADEIRGNGLNFVPLKMSRNRGHAIGEIMTILSLARLYRRLAPDLVHHVTIKPVLYGSLVARVIGIPTVNAISGFGHIFRPTQSRFVRASIEIVYRVALRSRRSLTIFQNVEDRRDFTSRGFLRQSHAVLIRGSGVDCDVFRPPPFPPSEKVVMFASRMLREKGVEDFVAAARQLKPHYPVVRFVLVGEVDDSPSSVSSAQLQAWHDEGRVEWWGHLDHMERILPQASMIVLPTFYREGLPKVLLEAGACGIPIIATDVPGCREIARHESTGLLIAPHDVAGLVVAIRRLLDDDVFRLRLGNQARSVVESEFTISRVVEQTLTLYRSLLASP